MTSYLTRDCACTATTGTGGRRPDQCKEHGNRFQTEAELKPKERQSLRRVSLKRQAEGDAGNPRRSRSTLKPSGPTRDWSLAQAKKEEEGCCRICKRSDRPLESAHVLGREHDEPKVGADGRPLKELIVLPVRIIPACGPFPDGCHGDVDMKRINYLPYLSLEEQLQAVKDAGGIAPAYMRLMPVEHREERERSAA